MPALQGTLNCGIVHDETGQPFIVLSISDSEDYEVVPPVVLGKEAVQELLGFITDYLIEVEELEG